MKSIRGLLNTDKDKKKNTFVVGMMTQKLVFTLWALNKEYLHCGPLFRTSLSTILLSLLQLEKFLVYLCLFDLFQLAKSDFATILDL